MNPGLAVLAHSFCHPNEARILLYHRKDKKERGISLMCSTELDRKQYSQLKEF